MSAASGAIQAAVFTRLRGFAGLTALLAASIIDDDTANKAVYDAPPQPPLPESSTMFPFVAIGADTAAEFDTDTVNGQETTVTVHSWTRENGLKKLKQIQAQLHAALHNHQLAVTGHHTILMLWEFAEVIPDPDPTIQHGVDRFRILTQST